MNVRPFLLLLIILLCACSEDSSKNDSNDLRVYRHALDGAPGSLDPAHASSIYANFLVVNLYDTLYRYKYLARPYELTPNLAEGMPEISDDGLKYIIRIKNGVHFIDDPAFDNGQGRELTASDFIYSIKRHFDPASRAQGAWLWQGRIAGLEEWKQRGAAFDDPVDGLQALDRYTIEIRLTRPFPQLMHTFTTGFSAIVPFEAVQHYGREFSNHPVGSGPFALQSIDNARATLLPNPKFRAIPVDLAAEGYQPQTQNIPGIEQIQGRAPPFLDRLHFDFIAEDGARWNALMADNVQFIKVPVSQFEQVLESRSPMQITPELREKFAFQGALESGFVYTNFNLDDPRIGYHPDPQQNTRNQALRCAVKLGFNWNERNRIFYNGIGQVFSGIVPPLVPEFDAALPAPVFDPQAARKLLAEHGWNADTLPVLEYGFPSNVTERQMFEQLRSFMVDIGWPPEKIRPITFATFGDYFRAYSNREVMLITSSWTMDYPDAENTIQLFYGPNAAPGSNSSNYNNADFDELYRRSAVLAPSSERTRLFRQMNQMVIDDCATISGLSRTLVFLWNKDYVMLPDRSFLNGYFLRFVDLRNPESGSE